MTDVQTDGLAVDADARRIIADTLERTLFVEAGAGAGKTRQLVHRVVSLVVAGVSIGSIAAITFTEKAAGELRDRIRAALEDRLSEYRGSGGDDDLFARRCRVALDVLDDAHIQTLHAFAQSILAAHAVASGLPPVFDVVDEIEAWIEFDRRWVGLLDQLLSEPRFDELMTVAWTLGLRGDRLRDLAVQFSDHWDLLVGVSLQGATVPTPDLAALADALDAVIAARRGCMVPGDKLLGHLDTEVAVARRQLDYVTDAVGAARFFSSLRRLNVPRGVRGNWRGPSKDDVLGLLDTVDRRADEARRALAGPVLLELCRLVAEFTLAGVDERRAAGRLQFHDLLVLTRDLLRGDPEARAAVGADITHLLVDEFQDTDPLQVELAVLIASVGQGSGPAVSWVDTEIAPGRLFFVGDPKQSIYRFRRADIGLYQRVRDHLAADRIDLTQNFRSTEPLLAWINEVFDGLMGRDEPGQARWAPLVHHRGPINDDPAVVLLGGPAAPHTAVAAVREIEAADVAEVCARIVGEEWFVSDTPTGADAGGPTSLRPARYDDVAILLPTRTALAALERAFEAVDIPYRVESRALLWSTQEVRDLVSVLRAIDDPSDEVSLVAALRSPLLACSDRDLVEWRSGGGHWNALDPVPEVVAADSPVAEAMRWLHQLHSARWRLSVSALVQQVVDDRAALELAFGRRRQRESWHRVRFLLDQARAFADRGGAGLRAFVDWAERQADEGAMAVETVVPESDDRAVRILTIHAAKGLEFPIVVVAGLNTVPRRWRPAEVLWPPGDLSAAASGPVVSVGTKDRPWHTPGYEAERDSEIAMEQQEAIRLLYVACTRARDHLVVSLHHKPDPPGARSQGACLAARLLPHAERADKWSRRLSRPDGLAAELPAGHDRADVPDMVEGVDPQEWLADRDAKVARLGRERSIAATGIGADSSEPSISTVPEPAEPDEPAGPEEEEESDSPVRRGRGGSAFGRAVHAVLQSVDLVTTDGLDGIASAQAAAEGIADQAAAVAATARAAVASPAVAEALAGRYWREVYVSAELDGVVVDGFVDLLVETGDGLVVVDYKTDNLTDESLPAAATRYRMQLATYAVVIEHNLGQPVSRAELVFARPSGVRQVHVDGLDDAKAEVRALVSRMGEAVAEA